MCSRTRYGVRRSDGSPAIPFEIGDTYRTPFPGHRPHG